MSETLKSVVSINDKYRLVAEVLNAKKGTILDVGARDEILSRFLVDHLTYFSADMGDSADYHVDLEQGLSLTDRSFDHVVALDVLEHVENAHMAFGELCRVAAQTVTIALPNMAALPHRISFFLRGRLATKKYDLQPTHQGDRHRWLTVYPDVVNFVIHNVPAHYRVARVIEQVISGRIIRWLAFPLRKLLGRRGTFLVERVIFVLQADVE